jgi:hypothetical protein
MATAYAQFTKERFASVKAAHPEAKGAMNVSKFIADEWKELSQEQKNSYKNKIVRKTRKAISPPNSSSSAAAGPTYDEDDLLAPVGFNAVRPPSPKKAKANSPPKRENVDLLLSLSRSPSKKNKTLKAKRKPNAYAEFMRNEGAKIRQNDPGMSQVNVVREVGKRWKNKKASA